MKGNTQETILNMFSLEDVSPCSWQVCHVVLKYWQNNIIFWIQLLSSSFLKHVYCTVPYGFHPK